MPRGVFLIAAAAGILLFAAASGWAQQDPSRWQDMLSEHPSEYRARVGLRYIPEEQVKDQNADFALFEESFSGSGLIWKDDVEDVRLSADVRHEGIRTTAILPDSGVPFPDDLWSVSVGATYRYLFKSGVVLGGSVSIGSASDEPFHSSREIVESVVGFVKLPSGERNAWLFGLAYSNNREYANSFPIPIIEYFFNPSWDFHAVVGFPMESLEWRATEDLTFQLTYALIHNIHALAKYRVADPLRVYVGFDWTTEGYLLVDRPDPKDRFFYDEKRAKGGVRLEFGEGWSFDLSAGYVFGRKYGESDRGLRSAFDRVEIGSGAYGLASLEWRLGQARVRPDGPPNSDK
jgi:hypothetical protein